MGTGHGGEQGIGEGRDQDGWEQGMGWVGEGDRGEQGPHGEAGIGWEQGLKESRSWREQGMEGTGTGGRVWSRALPPARCVARDDIMMVILISMLTKI